MRRIKMLEVTKNSMWFFWLFFGVFAAAGVTAVLAVSTVIAENWIVAGAMSVFFLFVAIGTVCVYKTYVVCLSCGKQFPANNTSCGGCGAKVPEELKKKKK